MTRYYPGFLAAFFIILLRVAIGWHFLTEGSEKYDSTGRGKDAFSAEIYLRNANGPLAPYFRELLPDVNGRDTLDLTKLKAAWREDVNRIADHFGFDEAQRSEASKRLDEAERWADHWFSDPENVEKREKYLHDLDKVQRTESDPQAMSYRARAGLGGAPEPGRRPPRADRPDRRARQGPARRRRQGATSEQVENARAPLLSRLAPRSSSASDSDAIKAAEAARPWTRLDWINFATTYGLIAIGICLILGFLTPLAALGAVAFLAMIYLSMPPWPGLPPNPKTEGHYFIVSKNLIELIACLVSPRPRVATGSASMPCSSAPGAAAGWPRRRRNAPRIRRRDGYPGAGPPRATKDEPDREPIPIG